MSDVKGIKEAVGTGFRKHITDYGTDIVAIPYNHPDQAEIITHSTDELTSVCPVSGLPDFYHLEISYVPRKLLPELKSLKFYLMSFRDVGVLHEDLAPVILKELVRVIDPQWIVVVLEARTRGGINTTVKAEQGSLKEVLGG